MTIFSSPARARLGRVGLVALVLLCEHERWLTDLSMTKVPARVFSVLERAGSSEPTWGDLLVVCCEEGLRQFAWSILFHPAEMFLFTYAVVETALVIRTLIRKLRSRKRRATQLLKRRSQIPPRV